MRLWSGQMSPAPRRPKGRAAAVSKVVPAAPRQAPATSRRAAKTSKPPARAGEASARPPGRPAAPEFDAKRDEILARISGGDELVTILADEGMPSRSVFFTRMVADAAFQDAYARAREAWAYAKADEIVEIADFTARDTTTTGGDHPRDIPDHEWIARSKLRVEARFRLMASYNAKRFGPKVDVTSDGEKLEHGVLLMPALDPRPVERSVAQVAKGGKR